MTADAVALTRGRRGGSPSPSHGWIKLSLFSASSPAGIAARIAFFYVAIFLILGISLPYFPLWLKAQGLSAVEIGLVTSVPLFIRIATTPMIGIAADRSGSVKGVVLAGAGVAMLSALALMGVEGLWPILVLFSVFQIASLALMPLAEVVAMREVRQHGLDYGRMRLWGSLAFIAANLGGGLALAGYGAHSILVLIIAASLVTLLAGAGLPGGGARRETGKGISLKAMMVQLARADLLLIMAASGLIQAAHAVYYAFSAIHWQALGLPETTFGVLWSIGVIAEVVLFAYAGRALKRIGALNMIAIGAAGSLVRWGAMASDPSFGLLVVLQLLHGLTFGATHLGVVHAIQERVRPDQAASAQSLHSALSSGIMMGGAMALAGAMYGPLGGLSYLVMVVLAAGGGALVLAAKQFEARSGAGRETG
jgi:PPP family 3-phenylpropionic acid transporter